MALISLSNICKQFGKGQSAFNALDDINLSIEAGEMVAVMGKSGSGKSTLLNLLGGLDSPTAGNYLFEGKTISGLTQSQLADFRRTNIGFVVQHFALIDDMTVFDNVALPLRYHRLSDRIIRQRVGDMLEAVEIGDKSKACPPELSSGQCQRAAIARALISQPALLLADEPTGALDQATGERILEIFQHFNQQGTTIVLVTHDSDVAASCQRVIQLSDGLLL